MADSTQPDGAGDARLEALLVQCIEVGEASGPAAVEKILADNREHASELRALLGSLAGLGFLGDEQNNAPFVDRIGPYQLLRRLGEGSMGVVYLARHDATDRLVALKTIKQLQAGSVAQERFRREALAIARLRHPNIVTVFDAGEYEGTAYLAMELLGGRPLDEIVGAGKRSGELLPPSDVIGWGRDIASALASAHDQGIVHRDVKPSNIRITSDDRAVLLDFGLARDVEAATLTIAGGFQGSPNFASPEQVDGSSPIGPLSDVFSLGVTLQCCLTNEMPFDGETHEQVFHQILTEEPPSPRRRNPQVSRDLATVIHKAIEKRPEDRYRSATALADDLQALLDHRPIAARRSGPLRRTYKWARRKPAAAVAVACLLLLVAVLSVALITRERTLDDLRAEQAAKETNFAVLTLHDLPREEESLWPATVERVTGAGGMNDWLRRAESLRGRLPDFERRLAELERIATARDPENAAERARLRDQIARREAQIARRDPRKGTDRQLLLFDRAALDSLVRRRLRTPPTLESPEREQEFLELLELVEGIPNLLPTIARVEERRRFALEVESRSIQQPAQDWKLAIASIAADPRYGGLALEPQVGLVPIGPDPDSNLWEFAHLQTGRVAQRDSRGGLLFTAECGLVFVLVPPGEFAMGARRPGNGHAVGDPNVDPACVLSMEGPVHTVKLDAFFVSKFEMTQAQWQRLTADNPSGSYEGMRLGKGAIGANHPVETVSYLDGVRWASRMGCRLPTEAQWEYAARAGTETVWWTGNDKRSLTDAANVADQHPVTSREAVVNWELEDWDDGYTYHAPVGSLRANAFGLHDVCGNVSEWCRDWYGSYEAPPRPKNGYRSKRSAAYVVARGGSYADPARAQRMARRMRFALDFTYAGLGLRPTRPIRP